MTLRWDPDEPRMTPTYMATWASNNFELSRDFRLINDDLRDSTIIPGHGLIFPKIVAAVGFSFTLIL